MKRLIVCWLLGFAVLTTNLTLVGCSKPDEKTKTTEEKKTTDKEGKTTTEKKTTTEETKK